MKDNIPGIANMNVLYDAFRASMKGSAWKREPQKFEHDWMTELTTLKRELETHTYKTLPTMEFKLKERGKVRHIHGNRMRDRVVRHALCDNILGPYLKPYLIHNNGASRKGKGLSFARKMFEKDLHNFWLKYRTHGYIGFIDLSKFYDNIRHDLVKELVYPKIPEENWWLMDEILSSMEVDVSYMTEEEYARCMDTQFNSVVYYETVPVKQRTGEKWMKKSLNIGDQVSQDVGVFFPHRIDNYAKIVRGLKYYGRYMDDIYFISTSREEAQSVIDGIREQAKKLGLFVNDKKTRIVKTSDTYKYLQVKYHLTDTGKVVKRISPKAVTRERRKLKAYKRQLDAGTIPYEDIEQAYRSWMGAYTHLMSKQQIRNMKELYKNLYGKEPGWKPQSHFETERRSPQKSTGTATSHRKDRISRRT
mgnify:CR=1 FL=1